MGEPLLRLLNRAVCGNPALGLALAFFTTALSRQLALSNPEVLHSDIQTHAFKTSPLYTGVKKHSILS